MQIKKPYHCIIMQFKALSLQYYADQIVFEKLCQNSAFLLLLSALFLMYHMFKWVEEIIFNRQEIARAL